MTFHRTILLGAVVALVAAGSPAKAAAPPTGSVTWYSTGDSYSSGEGVSGNAGACAQTRKAWGPAAAANLQKNGWKIPKVVFTACTGHLVGDHYIARSGTGKDSLWEWAVDQGAPSSTTIDVLTLSFGGNDIDFAHVIKDCLTGLPGDWSKESLLFDDCNVTEQQLRARVDALTNANALRFDTKSQGKRPEKVIGSLADFYVLVAQRHLSERGRLVVMGYPRLFAPSGEWGLWQGTRCNGVTRGDANMLGRVGEHLDAVVRSQILNANKTLGAERVLYVSALDLFGGAEGSRRAQNERHELCGPGEDWLNGEVVSANHFADEGAEYLVFRLESGFHPHDKGHAAKAQAVSDLLSSKGLLSAALKGKETGRVAFTHPTWGRSALVSTLENPPQGTGRLYVIDASGQIRWQHTANSGFDEFKIDNPATDKTGHLFATFNPGRYPGAIVLAPVANGMQDFRSLPDSGTWTYDTRFYNGVMVDKNKDGILEISVEENSCEPDCAGGQKSFVTYSWKGGDYVRTARSSALTQLKEFLEAWRRADRATMRKFAADSEIDKFVDGDGRDSTYDPPSKECDYEVSWGQCQIFVDLHSQGGYRIFFSFTFDMPNGRLNIDKINPEGDAG